MTFSAVRPIIFLSVQWVALNLASTANAAVITVVTDTRYTVTDLGNNFTLQQDASGAIHSIMSGDGSQTYAFEKSPVSVATSYLRDDFGNPGQYPTTTFSSGNLTFFSQVVDSNGFASAYQVTGPLGWGTGLHPINDINQLGYVVGSGGGVNGAFVSLPGDLGYQQYLNYVILGSPGIQLSSALKIDDLGDIIAQGTLNGRFEDFLLTPNGSPTPAPEPSTLVILAVGVTALGVRSARRRNSRPRSTAA